MSKRKIAECINVRINIGNYQHIELTKYAEEEIEFSSTKELTEKEDSLRNDLIASLTRSMKAIPERLGKGVENAVEVEETLKKAIPAWLENNPVPNISNGAKKADIRNSAEQMANKSAQKANSDDKKSIVEPIIDRIPETVETVEKSDGEKDLFEDDNSPSQPASTPIANEEAPESKSKEQKEKADDGFGVFGDDDDIFGDEK